MNSTPKDKAERLKKARGMTFLGLTAFVKKHNLVLGTVKSWELGLHGGLPEKGAHKIIQALKAENIVCTIEWLMYGVGNKPYNINQIATSQINHIKSSHIESEEEQRINTELWSFCQYYQDSTYLTVSDDGLFPFFLEGDLVAGIKYYGKNIRKAINMDCIVQIENSKEILLRNLCHNLTKDRYTLICKNQNTTVPHPVIYDVSLISAAPVIWLRRKR